MESDRHRWDERWSAQQTDAEGTTATAPDVIAAHPELLAQLPVSGRGLDLACGVGGQSLWMAGLGLDVLALDVSDVAIDLTTRAAAAHEAPIEARVWDTDDGLPADLDHLALIVCQRYRATDLYLELLDRLAPDGVLVLTVLSAVGLADTDTGPFHAPPGELTAAYRAAAEAGIIDVLLDDERDGQASIVLRRRPA